MGEKQREEMDDINWKNGKPRALFSVSSPRNVYPIFSLRKEHNFILFFSKKENKNELNSEEQKETTPTHEEKWGEGFGTLFVSIFLEICNFSTILEFFSKMFTVSKFFLK